MASMEEIMQRVVLSLLVRNNFGVLTRVTNLFSQRGFNIDTLAVGETEDARYSRITVTTHGDSNIINQIKLQLAKLEDVKGVFEIEDESLFIREVLLVKVDPEEEQKEGLEAIINTWKAKVQIIEGNCQVIELTDHPASVEAFIELMREYHIVEICRTGGAALKLSNDSVY